MLPLSLVLISLNLAFKLEMWYFQRLASIRGPHDVMKILLLSQVLLYMMLAFKLQLRYQGLVGRGLTHKGAWKVDVGEGVEAMQQLLKKTKSV